MKIIKTKIDYNVLTFLFLLGYFLYFLKNCLFVRLTNVLSIWSITYYLILSYLVLLK